MIRILLSALLIFGFASAVQAKDPGPKDFAREMVAMVRKALPGQKVTPSRDDPLVLEITSKDDVKSVSQLYLTRIYTFCLRNPGEPCEASKQNFVRRLSSPPGKLTLPSLRYVVRDQSYVDTIAEFSAKLGKPAAYVRKLGDDLYMVLVSDSPDTIALVGEVGLDELGITVDQGWLLAISQTREVIPSVPEAAAVRSKLQVYDGKEYVGSMLGETKEWRKLSNALGPDLFVTVVSDQLVVVGLLPDGPRMAAFAESVSADCDAAERCISPHVYRFRNGQWMIAN